MCVPGRYRLPRSLSTSVGVVAIGKGARDDAFDYLALCVGVVLDVGPFASGKFALGVLVANSLVVMRAKAIAEGQHPFDLRTTLTEDVEVDVRIGTLEQAVLEPVGLADAQDVSGGLHRRHECTF